MMKRFYMLIAVAALVVTVDSNKNTTELTRRTSLIGKNVFLQIAEISFEQLVNRSSWPEKKKTKWLKNMSTGVAAVNLGLTVYNDIQAWKEEAELLKNLEHIQNLAREINDKVDKSLNQQATTMDMLHKLPELLQHVVHITEMEKYVLELNRLYARYEKYSANITKYEKYTLLDYADTALSHKANAIDDILVQMHAIVIPPHSALRKKGILGFMASTLKNAPFKETGRLDLFPRQVFDDFYGYFLTARVRGTIVKMFGYSIRKLYGLGSYIAEMQLFYDRYIRQISLELELVINILEWLPRVMWKSDPKVHLRGQTFDEITYLLQGYIRQEYDLSYHWIWGRCRFTCNAVTKGVKTYSCTDKLCRDQKPCPPKKIVSCDRYKGKSLIVYVQKYAADNRRYTGFTAMPLGKLYGKNEVPNDRIRNVSNYWWYSRGWVYCEYCLCLCDDDDIHSHRYFNLRPMIADTKNNSVVTGLQFVKHNKIFHLIIQEGKLLPEGIIDPKTVKWRRPENYKVTDSNIKEGRDYHKLTGDVRVMDLDDIWAKKDHVIIGVRLTLRKGYIVKLSIITSSFNYTTGNLTLTGQEKWITNTAGTNKEIELKNIDFLSFETATSSEPFPGPRRFVYFEPTSWLGDAAQRTVPSFDMQAVASIKPLPLGGCGLYYKGRERHGGFVAPKIFMYDID